MPSFQSKIYQQEALDSIATYFRECQSRGHADYAFQEATKQLWGKKSSFTPLKGFPVEMPYFCLRVPTGGGKTYLAAKSVLPEGDLNQILPYSWIYAPLAFYSLVSLVVGLFHMFRVTQQVTPLRCAIAVFLLLFFSAGVLMI